MLRRSRSPPLRPNPSRRSRGMRSRRGRGTPRLPALRICGDAGGRVCVVCVLRVVLRHNPSGTSSEPPWSRHEHTRHEVHPSRYCRSSSPPNSRQADRQVGNGAHASLGPERRREGRLFRCSTTAQTGRQNAYLEPVLGCSLRFQLRYAHKLPQMLGIAAAASRSPQVRHRDSLRKAISAAYLKLQLPCVNTPTSRGVKK